VIYQLLLWYRGLPFWARFAPLLAIMVLCVVLIYHVNESDRAEHDAEFLVQCHDAGYDAAKCRFFLTAAGSTNSDAAVQMIIQSATH
jgi:hypothetical protein